ncbi:hypothetical protein GMOD_00000550 [Pyrenophora seminiperda CCB06]|uniref:Uncharacterized protein n=1 Tax=Pyrenophora seminiperda CCB06 TaxID=1302712 RepID=A0A3M7M7U3_9PLEO|nr:hypothetical protein GMOD_00000550 [Pyrenophora seminiperda CCB06]
MSPKNPIKTMAETSPQHQSDHVRSVYGDGYAERNHALLVAHAVHLGTVGAIDEHMVAELTKPIMKMREQSIKYSQQYLAAHPDYTGENVDAIPTLQMARKHQRDRDAAQMKLLVDYRAGKIDIWGRCVNGNGESETSSSCSSGASIADQGIEDEFDVTSLALIKEHTSDTKDAADGSFTASSLSSLPDTSTTNIHSPKPAIAEDKHSDGGAEDMEASSSSPLSSPVKDHFSAGASPPTTPPPPPSQRPLPSLAVPLKLTTPEPNLPSCSTKRPTKDTSQRARVRSRRHVSPLKPLPGKSTYESLDYYKAAALCRKRGICSGGNVQEVRNTLIQDDKNVQLGLQRSFQRNGHKRKKAEGAGGKGE